MVSADSGKLAPWTPPASQDTEPPKLLHEGERGGEAGREGRGGRRRGEEKMMMGRESTKGGK